MNKVLIKTFSYFLGPSSSGPSSSRGSRPRPDSSIPSGPSSTGSFCGSRMRRRIAAECTREERFQWASCRCVPEETQRSAGSSERPPVFSSSTSRREFVEKSKTVVKKTDKSVVKVTDKETTVDKSSKTVVVERSSSPSGPRRPSSGRPDRRPRHSGPSSRPSGVYLIILKIKI